MKIETFELGALATNAYVVFQEGDKNCWIVDAPDHPTELIEYITDQDLNPVKLILTHAHCDHIEGIGEILEFFPNLPLYLHPLEWDFLKDPLLNLSSWIGNPVVIDSPPLPLQEGPWEPGELGTWEIFHVPGHSPGSLCFYSASASVLIAGDTLFRGSIGRTDFPTSQADLLVPHIVKKLLALPEETVVFPGHGPRTSIGREKTTNPYLLD